MIKIIINLIAISFAAISSATIRDFSFQGYLKNTPILWKPSAQFYTSDRRRFDNLLHSRQNLRWYPQKNIDFAIDLKSRFFIGESAADIQNATDAFSLNDTYFNLKHTFITEKNAVLTGEIDRAFVNLNSRNLQITIGRQRVAWGVNLVWNVIDLFNPASPLDFDNEERPGSDAFRVQYYSGPESKIEFACAPGRDDENSTIGALFKFNCSDYDFHLLGGFHQHRCNIGFAWAGQISGAGFRGECLSGTPDSCIAISNTELTAALSGDYTFTNSTYLHSEIIFNSEGTTSSAGGLNLYQAYLQHWYTPARYSIFGEIARELSPLVRVDLSCICNPDDKSCYLGPSLIWSASTNLDFTGMALFFAGNKGTEFGDNGEMIMGRLKWSF